MSYNRVILMGNLTRNCELRHTQGGQAICQMGLAVTRKYKTQAGENQEEVCFVDITVWGKQGESCNQYLRKGSKVLVEGYLKLDTWDDRETGRKRSKHNIVGENVRFLDAPSNDKPSGKQPTQPKQQPKPKPKPPASGFKPPASAFEAPPSMPSFENDMEDDIPF